MSVEDIGGMHMLISKFRYALIRRSGIRKRSPRSRCAPRGAAIAALLALGIVASATGGRAEQLYVNPPISTPTDWFFTVDICRQSGAGAMGIDCEITFDPAIVKLEAITAGPWLTGSGFPYFFYDYTAPDCASIRFSTSLLGAVESGAQGPIAVCHFRARRAGISPLTFTLVDVRDDANQPLGFGHSTGDKIIIDYAVPVEPETFGRLKNLYR